MSIQKALLDLSPDAALAFDECGHVTWLSSGAERLFGLAAAEVTGESIQRILPGFDVGDCLRRLDRAGTSESSRDRILEIEVEARTEAGTSDPHAMRIKRIGVGAESIVVAIIRPLDRITAELRESREMLKAVADSTTAVIYIKDSDGRYILVNRRFEVLFHVENDAIRGKTDHDLFPKDLADGLRANDLAVQRRGCPIEFDEAVPSDGESRQYISLKVPLIGPSGEVYAVCGISTDITERKRAEHEVAETYKHLQSLMAARPSASTDAETRLREETARRERLLHQLSGVIATASEGIWAFGVDGRTTFVNPRMAAMLGYTVDEMIGKPMYSFMNEQSAERREGGPFVSGQGDAQPNDFELRRKDGASIWTLMSTSVIRGARGQVVGSLAMVTDITDRKRGEEHQNRLLRELDHRVKNCLATVVALADLTMSRAASFAEFRESFGERLQAFARTHETLAQARWQDVGFGDVVDEVLAAHGAAFRERIVASGEPVRIPPRVVTPLALTLSELGTNALKHGALANPHGEIRVDWKMRDDGRFELTWIERLDSPAAPPTREGTGMMLMRGLVEYELAGSLELDFEPEGLRCRVIVPSRSSGSDDAV
jgi:PAS domain S-box-containing protein